MNNFFRFIASPTGRVVRVAAGLTLAGSSLRGAKKPNLPLLVISMVPLAAGLFDWCVMGPLAGKPFEGEALRRQLGA
jgi:hypothetical protein